MANSGLSDGDYYIFAGRGLSFGTFGHPWEATLCVWGAELIDTIENRNTGVLTHLHRRNGEPISRPQPSIPAHGT